MPAKEWARGWPPPSWVYAAVGEDGTTKIGATHDVPKRLRLLPLEYWQKYQLHQSWHRPHDARKVEYVAHALLRDARVFKDGRVCERYEASIERVTDVVELAIAKVDQGDLSDLPRHSVYVRPGAKAARMSVSGFQKALIRARKAKEAKNAKRNRKA